MSLIEVRWLLQEVDALLVQRAQALQELKGQLERRMESLIVRQRIVDRTWAVVPPEFVKPAWAQQEIEDAVADMAAALTARTQALDHLQGRCVIGLYCRTHGFIHGAEAEELRERLAALKHPRVNEILDDVDARDSVAWLEWKPEAADAARVSRAPHQEQP